MSNIVHTAFCTKTHQVQEEWDALWPNACKECGATGFVSYYEPIDEIGGMYQNDECGGCMAEGKCPRCGHQHGIEWNIDECVECGWDAELTDPSMWRPVALCECWNVEQYAIERMDQRYVLSDVDEEHYDYLVDDLAFDEAREKRMR